MITFLTYLVYWAIAGVIGAGLIYFTGMYVTKDPKFKEAWENEIIGKYSYTHLLGGSAIFGPLMFIVGVLSFILSVLQVGLQRLGKMSAKAADDLQKKIDEEEKK